MSAIGIREAIETLGHKLVAQPEKARAKNAPATASLDAGLRFRVVGPNGEEAVTDMPPAMGGAASAPNPGWYMRAAMATCCGTMIAIRAAQLGIVLKALDVSVESESDNRGMLGLDDAISAGLSNLRTKVRIAAENASERQLNELVRWAERHSPVGCTVRDAPRMTLDVTVA